MKQDVPDVHICKATEYTKMSFYGKDVDSGLTLSPQATQPHMSL